MKIFFILCTIALQALGGLNLDQPQDHMRPSSLFKIEINRGENGVKEVYCLGSRHTIPFTSYPHAVQQVIKDLVASHRTTGFFEIDGKAKRSNDFTNFYLKNYGRSLKEDVRREFPTLMNDWYKTVQEWRAYYKSVIFPLAEVLLGEEKAEAYKKTLHPIVCERVLEKISLLNNTPLPLSPTCADIYVAQLLGQAKLPIFSMESIHDRITLSIEDTGVLTNHITFMVSVDTLKKKEKELRQKLDQLKNSSYVPPKFIEDKYDETFDKDNTHLFLQEPEEPTLLATYTRTVLWLEQFIYPFIEERGEFPFDYPIGLITVGRAHLKGPKGLLNLILDHYPEVTISQFYFGEANDFKWQGIARTLCV